MPSTSPSVLLIRLDGIGDALALCPLVAALRERDIPVDGIFSEVNVDAFATGALRKRWIAPFSMRDSSQANLDAIAGFGAVLGERGYSHVLVATEDPGGYRLARATNAPQRIGFANGWGKPLKTVWVKSMLTQELHRPAALAKRAVHECEVLFELGRSLLGPDAQPTRDPRTLARLVLDNPKRRVKYQFAMQVTDKWDRLGISFDEVAACAGLFPEGWLRAFGSQRESEYAKRFEHATGVEVDLFEDVPSWKAAIGTVDSLIAPDGGAIHVAGMIGTSTVAIFPPQRDFALQSARWSPWAALFRLMEARPGWPALAIVAAIELTSTMPDQLA